MDFAEKLVELEAEKAALTKDLAEAKAAGDKDVVLKLYDLLKANTEAQTAVIPKCSEPQKRVTYVDETGEEKHTDVSAQAFTQWMNDASALVPLFPDGDTESPVEIREWSHIDEAITYRQLSKPLDLKATIHHLVEIQEIEFGRACEELIRSNNTWKLKCLHPEKVTEQNRKGKPLANEFQVRLDRDTELDFLAINTSPHCPGAVVGSYQLSLPTEKKLKKLFDVDIPKVVKRFAVPQSKTDVILGVSRANPASLESLKVRWPQIKEVFVRSGRGFRLM